jgi:hypothetical protein
MKPILNINLIRSNDKNFLNYRITITQGAEMITSSDLLLDYLKKTIPFKKGIIDVTMITYNTWEIKTNK